MFTLTIEACYDLIAYVHYSLMLLGSLQEDEVSKTTYENTP